MDDDGLETLPASVLSEDTDATEEIGHRWMDGQTDRLRRVGEW